MLELVFVILVIGILASVIIPRTKTNSLQEAAIQLVSDIRYTQHLAMIDDKYDSTDSNWYRNRWQLLFGRSEYTDGKYAYTIFSDYLATSQGNPELTEIAVNPLDRNKLLSGGYSGELDWKDPQATKKLNIGYSYGVVAISTHNCGAKRIAFDNLGRPFKGNDSSWNSSTDGILKKQCIFTLHGENETINIYIEPETGYVHL